MNTRFWGFLFLNFCAVLLLTVLIVGPLFIAKNMAKVAGVKSESRFLVVSQIEKFPNLNLSQKENVYSISYTKQSPSQAYIGVLIVNNPTAVTQTYSIERISSQAQAFFGEDLGSQTTKISVPPVASVPISFISEAGLESESQTVEFKIIAEGE